MKAPSLQEMERTNAGPLHFALCSHWRADENMFVAKSYTK